MIGEIRIEPTEKYVAMSAQCDGSHIPPHQAELQGTLSLRFYRPSYCIGDTPEFASFWWTNKIFDGEITGRNQYSLEILREIRQHSAEGKEINILELGVGNGELIHHLRRFTPSPSAVDIAPYEDMRRLLLTALENPPENLDDLHLERAEELKTRIDNLTDPAKFNLIRMPFHAFLANFTRQNNKKFTHIIDNSAIRLYQYTYSRLEYSRAIAPLLTEDGSAYTESGKVQPHKYIAKHGQNKNI